MLCCKVKVIDQSQEAAKRQLGRKSPEGKTANAQHHAAASRAEMSLNASSSKHYLCSLNEKSPTSPARRLHSTLGGIRIRNLRSRIICILAKRLAMITKDQVISSLKEMPAQFSIDELMDKLILLQKIDIGLEHSKQGEVYSSHEAKEMLKQWSK